MKTYALYCSLYCPLYCSLYCSLFCSLYSSYRIWDIYWTYFTSRSTLPM